MACPFTSGAALRGSAEYLHSDANVLWRYYIDGGFGDLSGAKGLSVLDTGAERVHVLLDRLMRASPHFLGLRHAIDQSEQVL